MNTCLFLASTVTNWVSISAFASVFFVPVGITNPAVGLKICAITTEIKKYKSIIKKGRKKHDKIVLLGRTRLDSFEVLISKVLISWQICFSK